MLGRESEMLSPPKRRGEMKTLVYGAGVLGSLYAAKLKEARHDVEILARGERLEEIRANGLMLVDASKGRRTVTRVDVVEALNPDDTYDLIVSHYPQTSSGLCPPHHFGE